MASNSQMEVQVKTDTCEVVWDSMLDMVVCTAGLAARMVCRNSNYVLSLLFCWNQGIMDPHLQGA